jgi:hypothetical protein
VAESAIGEAVPDPEAGRDAESDLGDVQELAKDFTIIGWEWWAVALHLPAPAVAAHSQEVRNQLLGTEFEVSEPS